MLKEYNSGWQKAIGESPDMSIFNLVSFNQNRLAPTVFSERFSFTVHSFERSGFVVTDEVNLLQLTLYYYKLVLQP